MAFVPPMLSSSTSTLLISTTIINLPPIITTRTKSPFFFFFPISSTKIPRCQPLDRHAAKHSKLRFARKLKTLLLSKPRQFLPLRILSRCHPYLGLHRSRSLRSMILHYPALFHLFYAPSRSSPTFDSLLSVTLTPAAAAHAADESLLRARFATSLASKLQCFLMLSPRRCLLLSKLIHLAPDLGLPPDFRSRLCNRHPDRFRTIDTSNGRALKLVSWDPSLPSKTLPLTESSTTPPGSSSSTSTTGSTSNATTVTTSSASRSCRRSPPTLSPPPPTRRGGGCGSGGWLKRRRGHAWRCGRCWG